MAYIVLNIGAITFALIFQKFRLRLSYTCPHKSGAFALRFGVTFARTFSQLFLGQLLVFNKVLALISLFTEIERYVDGDGKSVLRIDYENSYNRLWGLYQRLNQPAELVETVLLEI